jgi:hypothetical protein
MICYSGLAPSFNYGIFYYFVMKKMSFKKS